MSDLKDKLLATAKKLETAETRIKKSQGYTKEAAKIGMLKELLKEQIPNEVTYNTTRAAR